MKLRSLSATVLLVVLVLASAALAQLPGPFSADVRTTTPRHQTLTGKLYFSGNNVRIQMSMPAGEGGRAGMGSQESIVIHNMSRNVTYMLLPQQRMYMEVHGNEIAGPGRPPEWKAYDPSNPCANKPGVTCKKVGTETVNGRTCDRWEFTGKNPDSNETVWIDQKTHIPIKRQGADGSVFELTNINEGPQPADLFEVPAGYQKLDMGGMMRGQRP